VSEQTVHIVDDLNAASGAQSVDRALRVLDAVAERPGTAAGLATLTGLPRPTVARLLNVLQQRRYVQRRENGIWEIGSKVVSLAARWYEQVGLARLAQPELERLAERFQESAYICVRDGLSSLCVAGVESPRSVRFSLSIGARTQLHAGAINEVLLAFSPPAVIDQLIGEGLPLLTPKTLTSPESLRERLAAIRARGWWETDGEADEGVTSIAAPILGSGGHFEASLGVSGPTGRLEKVGRGAIQRDVIETAARLTELLGGRPSTQQPSSGAAA
jgi:DNA-binding IclR family transcriptional regulator